MKTKKASKAIYNLVLQEYSNSSVAKLLKIQEIELEFLYLMIFDNKLKIFNNEDIIFQLKYVISINLLIEKKYEK